MTSKLKKSLKCIKIEAIKDEDYFEFIKMLNINFKFMPEIQPRPSLLKQMSVENKTKNDYNYDDDDSNKYSSLPASLTKKSLSFSKIEENEVIIPIQIDKEQMTFIYESIDLRVEIFQEDLLETRVDVIVNAANNRLQLGGKTI